MKKLNIIHIATGLLLLFSCGRETDFLSIKPNQSLVIPTTLKDFEDLMNKQSSFTLYTDLSHGSASSDEFYVTDNQFKSFEVECYRNLYIWSKEIEGADNFSRSIYAGGWITAYHQVFVCNVVLEGLDKLPATEKKTPFFNEIRGRALFLRSWAFYNLVQTYAMPYDPKTATTELGIPLRLASDINLKVSRASVQECYDRIISDVTEAAVILPMNTIYKTNPSGIAALGFLARIYLALGNYPKALEASEKFLAQYNVLTDYNTLSSSRTSSIRADFMEEDVFQVSMESGLTASGRILPELYNSYDEDDLRKTRFFRMNTANAPVFKGSYSYWGGRYTGIATDEIYLIRAECLARNDQIQKAMEDINHLLKYRWDKNSVFVPLKANDAKEAISIILKERRKELIARGLRWTDLRRLNREPEHKTTLVRTISGETYTLQPNDRRYAMPIPLEEIQLSGLEQNKR